MEVNMLPYIYDGEIKSRSNKWFIRVLNGLFLQRDWPCLVGYFVLIFLDRKSSLSKLTSQLYKKLR